MKPIDDCEWLEIELAIECDGSTNGVVFSLAFQNGSEVGQDLFFANRRREAERHGLVILSLDGERIEPESVIYVSPSDPPRPRRLGPGEVWTYRLCGEIVDDRLRFFGATYRLRSGQEYIFWFRYRAAHSEKKRWRVPASSSAPGVRSRFCE